MPATAAVRTDRHRKERRTHLERTELSDRLMLAATKALILEVGTRATTLKDVGERAGYSRGLAKARFGDKDQLFLRLTESCLDRWVAELQRVAAEQRGLAALMARLDAIPSFVERFPEDARVLYILWFESVGSPSPMREGLASFHARARADIEACVTQAIEAREIAADTDPQQLGMHFTSVVFGLSYQWLVAPDAVDIESTMTTIKQDLLSILRPPPG